MTLPELSPRFLFKELTEFLCFRARNAETHFAWLRMLATKDAFFEPEFNAEATTSSRHPVNWFLALATQTPAAPDPGNEALRRYARILLTGGQYKKSGRTRPGLAAPAELLKTAPGDIGAWERKRMVRGESRLLGTHQTLQCLRHALAELGLAGRPLPLATAIDLAPGWYGQPLTAEALFAGLRYLLLYPHVASATLCIAVWPYPESQLPPELLESIASEPPADAAPTTADPPRTIAASPRKRRPDPTTEPRPFLPPLPPKLPEPPAGACAEPRVPQDLFCFLNTVRSQKIRITVQGRLYASSVTTVAAGLSPLPAWIELSPASRIQIAAVIASRQGWINVKGKRGQSAISLTPAGAAWMELPPTERQRHLLDLLRSPDALKEDTRLAILPELPTDLTADQRDRRPLDPLPVATLDYLRAFLGRLENDAFYLIDQLTEEAGRCRHPFRNRQLYIRSENGFSAVPPENLDALWRLELTKFLSYPLCDYGCVAIAQHEDGLCMALNDAGRYLLGLIDEPPTADDRGRVVLQPNFELVFVAPSPTALAALAPYCERLAAGHVGTLFRLDRDAVFSALRHGTTAETIFDTLQRYTDSIPDNVAAELRTWCNAVVRVRTSRLEVIQCSGPTEAARILAAAAKHLTPLTDTILMFRPDTKPAALTKALAKHGIFLDS